MGRKDYAENRSFYRWEFLRRNNEYQKRYNKLTKKKDRLIDLEAISEKDEDYFIKEFFVYPINPNFTYKQITNEHKRLARLKKEYFKKIREINKKYLGKESAEKNRRVSNTEKGILNEPLPKKGFTTKYLKNEKKAEVEIKRFFRNKNTEQVLAQEKYISNVCHQLSAPRLSSKKCSIDLPHSTVIRSYLAGRPNIQVSGYEYGIDFLTLINLDEDADFIIDNYKGEIKTVCFEVDLSYQRNKIIADMKRELSKWKGVKKKYEQQDKKRQNLYNKDVLKMLKIFDLREEKGLKYREISEKIFGSSSADKLQKVRNMYKKAKKLVEGGYKQIK